MQHESCKEGDDLVEDRLINVKGCLTGVENTVLGNNGSKGKVYCPANGGTCVSNKARPDQASGESDQASGEPDQRGYHLCACPQILQGQENIGLSAFAAVGD
jgi:hypothetical protein